MKEQVKKYTGVISVNGKGTGYFKVEGQKVDIEIQSADLNKALNGDTVVVTVKGKSQRGRPAGKVVEIKNRAKKNFAGVLREEKKRLFVIADDKKMYVDITITKKDQKVNIGDKVLVRITKWEKSASGPEGEIIKVLGKHGEHNAEMLSIVLEKGFETEFAEVVEKEAEQIEKTEKPIPASEIAKRKDFRQTLTFTIDPKTAKDFDDAISFKILSNGNYEIGVHIADVSHYVREGSHLDKEALKREFSVYMVDRTIPMLPEVLSNDICSLNPNEDRLTFSAVFEMNAKGQIFTRWFGKTVINSDKRFTYEDAQETLNKKDGLYFKELNILNEIAKKLRTEKTRQGAIDFEQDEVVFDLDANNKPIRIYKKQRLDTHKLVEEYMLLANKEVAEFIFKAYKKTNSTNPFLYRIHDLPDQEKIAQLSIFVKALGYELPIEKKNGITGKDLQNLFRQIEGKDNEGMIKTAAVRSMAKAIYSTKNIGHFGLAFEFYTHFTSPIRRYPDLLVHRLLFKHLKDEKLPKSEWLKYEKISIMATEQEIKAAEAERDSKKYKQIEYMMERIGQTFDGIISGITEWGVYIEEKDTRSEGMVKIRDLGNDYFVLDQKNYCLVGEKTKKKFSLGDKVKFKITGADLERKTLDLELLA
ncbi:MAG: ribonuclease R [Candidatus Paceibacterota bacterium]